MEWLQAWKMGGLHPQTLLCCQGMLRTNGEDLSRDLNSSWKHGSNGSKREAMDK